MADHAREIAELGDRWFLSLAAGVGRAGGWVRREADIVADSAVAAFATTMMVAKKLTAFAASGLEPPKAKSAREEEASPPPPALVEGLPLGLGLLHAQAPDGRRGASPAGIVPLLQALGRTVARHTEAGYASLQEDPRFWTLIDLVQRLGRPTLAAPVGDAPTPDSYSYRDRRRES